jgi:hypothetical protein
MSKQRLKANKHFSRHDRHATKQSHKRFSQGDVATFQFEKTATNGPISSKRLTNRPEQKGESMPHCKVATN